MKTQRVKLINYRNVPDMDMELNGKNILLVGENTVGKSNLIKAILGALGLGFGKNAVRNGQNTAEIEIKLADFTDDYKPIPGTEYIFKAEIEKKGEQEEVKLSVIAPNGMKDKRKSAIGSIVGELELDYNFVELSRTASGKKKQIEIIKSYLDADTKELLAIEENRVATAYDDRTNIGRLRDAARGFLKTAGVSPDDFKKYEKPIDTSKLSTDLEAAGKVNQQITEVAKRIEERKALIPIKENEIKALEQKIASIREELIDIATKNSEANKFLEANKPVDTTAIKQQISDAEKHNKMFSNCEMLSKKQKEANDAEAEFGELTALIETGRQAISDAIKDMDLPIDGISFDSETVYYKGKIVDENNMSTAEIMMLEAQLKMCKAPGAEVLFIQRGESLGTKLLAELQAKAKENGFQIIMEQVQRDTEELKVEFMPEYLNKLQTA
ncbi:MAG: hypothetical protein V4549_06490 [Bacteroidota bacterium]